MRFLLAFVLSFVSLFAIAQAPPMVLGGPQGIDVTRLLVRNWMTTPIYVDTPAAPLTGSGWPGRGYLITVIKNETPCVNCPPKDTTLWMYTGARWKRVGYDYITKLVYGGQVSKASGNNLNYIIQPYGAFFDGDYKSTLTNKTATLAPKTINNTARIDVLVLNRDSFLVKTGIPKAIPQKPLVTGSEVEVASFYFAAFDSIPTIINTSSKVTNIYRVAGIDSFYFNIDTLTYAIKDSVGITKNDTASMLNNYKFTAANGLTKDSTVFRLGGSLNQNTNINLNTRRLTFIGGSDTTRFFANGSVNIGGAATDSTYKLNVNGNTRVTGYLDLQPSFNNNTAVIRNQASTDGSIMFVGQGSVVSSSPPARNVIIDPVTRNYTTLTGSANTLIGRFTGQTLTNGGQNTFIGLNAGYGVTTGSNNIMILNNNGPVPYTSSVSSSIIMSPSLGDSSIFGLTNRYAYIGGGSETNTYINDFYFGGGHRVRFPNTANLNFYAPSAWPSKADTIGSNFTINAGRGSGTGLGGSVIFRTSDTTAAGTTLQTLTERARITPAGNLLVGTTSDSTFRLNVSGRAIISDTLTLSTTPVTADTSANDLLVINSSNGQVRRYTGDWYSVPLTGSATLDFPSTGHGNSADLTITVTGADIGDVVALGIPNASIVANASYIAWVSATNTVTVRFNNYASSGNSDPASGTFKIKVFK